MSFSKMMAVLPLLTRDPILLGRGRPEVSAGPGARRPVGVQTWERLLQVVRERPVVSLILDTRELPGIPGPEGKVTELARRFPSVGCVLIIRPETSPTVLLRLGRAATPRLGLVDGRDLAGRRDTDVGLDRALARVEVEGCSARVLRAVAARIPGSERQVLRAAMEGVLAGWGADDLAMYSGWTRPHLSVRLKACGLPSTGRLLVWARLLHAAHWLVEPGRSGQSVARQLGYNDGAAFRRALRRDVKATPTELRERGGLGYVLPRFLDVCGLDGSLGANRSVA